MNFAGGVFYSSEKLLRNYDIPYVSTLDTDELYRVFREEFKITSNDSKLNS